MAEEESVYCGLTASRVNVPLMSCCKRVKAAAEDRLSALPDTLLHQILFSLGTKEVIMTCVLSKRWQFLWTDSSKFELIEHSRDIAKIGKFVDWVGRVLLMCGGTHLQTLIVRFWYQHCFASNINLWVQFVVKNKIKVFGLFFLSNDDLYVLPQMLYSDSALTTLALGPCSISPNVGIDWRFLKSLLFFYVKLEDSVFQKILVGCPVLEVLTLNYCWGLDHMKIYAQNLNELVIDSWRHAESNHCLVITAPYLHTVKVIDAIITRVVVVGHFPFLVTAKVDYRFRNDTFAQVDSMILPNVKRSLESFRDVKELELGPWCIEVLSRLEERGLNLSPSTRLCLTLTAWRHKRSIAGILHVLKSSPNLETLVIKGTSLEPNLIYESHNEAASYLRDDGLDLVLPNLKTIELSGLSKAGLSGEPMLTLVRLLLKSAANLEKMVIESKRMSGYTLTTCYSTEFTEISLKLLSFPRSSTKAVVMVR